MNYFALLFFGAISISYALTMENDHKRKIEDEESLTFSGQNQLKKIKFEESLKEKFRTIEIFRKKPMAMMDLAFSIFIKKGEIDGPYKRLTYSEKDRFYFNHFQNYFMETGIKTTLPDDLFESYLKKIHDLKPSSLPVPLKVKILCLTTWSGEDFAEIFDDPFWAKPQSTRFLDQQMVKDVSIKETLSYDSPTFSSSLSDLKNKCDEFHRLELLIEAEGLCPHAEGITKALLESGAPIYALKLSWLHDVDITDKGAMAISDMLRTNKTLGRLDLGSNNLNEGGMFNIIESLKFNNTLNHINISAYEDKWNIGSGRF